MSQTTTPSGADVLALLTVAACSVASLAKIRRDAGLTLAADLYEMESQELDAARTTVAALIARNAELEADRNMLGQAIADAAHKAGITRADAMIDGPMLLMLCDDLANCAAMPDALIEERDALAAENKTLREALDLLSSPSCSMTTGNATSYIGWQAGDGLSAQQRAEVGRAALAHTTAKGNDDG